MAKLFAALDGLTVKALRELAKKRLGAGYSRLKTKADLLKALAGKVARAKPPAEVKAPKRTKPKVDAKAKPAVAREPPAAEAAPKREAKPKPTDAPGSTPGSKEGPKRESKPMPPDERLGELPDRYHDDAFVALSLDPHSLFVYWDFAPGTTAEAMKDLRGARAVLRILDGSKPLRELDFALESRSFYVRGLAPGATYQAEIQLVGEDGQRRRLGRLSNQVGLPTEGPSPVIEDHFVAFPKGGGRALPLRLEDRRVPGLPRHAASYDLAPPDGSSRAPLRPWLPGGVESAGAGRADPDDSK